SGKLNWPPSRSRITRFVGLGFMRRMALSRNRTVVPSVRLTTSRSGGGDWAAANLGRAATDAAARSSGRSARRAKRSFGIGARARVVDDRQTGTIIRERTVECTRVRAVRATSGQRTRVQMRLVDAEQGVYGSRRFPRPPT